MAVPRPNNWLNAAARNDTSQYGEDGIIKQILDILPNKDGWCVEFGAWDGKYLSNTCHLITRRDYSAVLIEGDPTRFQTLKANFAGNPKVHCFNRFVGMEPEDGLDSILVQSPIGREFDVLSIDIDGNDYHCWNAVQKYQPKVVIIEFNPTMPDEVEFVQPKDPQVNWSSSPLSLVKLGKRKGYELVATTGANAIFVDARYFPLFGITDNSLHALRSTREAVSYIFHGQDGTVMIEGAKRMLWHDIPLNPAAFQPLPPALRKFPDSYNEAERSLFAHYKELYKALCERDPVAAARLPNLGQAPKPVILDYAELHLWRALGGALSGQVARKKT